MKVLCTAALVALGLTAGANAQITVVDFGTDAGKYSLAPVDTFGTNGGARTVTYGADFAQIDVVLPGDNGTFKTAGIEWDLPGTFAGLDPNLEYVVTARHTPGVHQDDGDRLDYFQLEFVMINQPLGENAEYQAVSSVSSETPFQDGPAAVFTDVSLGAIAPESTNLTGGAYTRLRLFYQNGFDPGSLPAETFSLQVDKIELVPEPASVSLLGMAGLAALRRRR